MIYLSNGDTCMKQNIIYVVMIYFMTVTTVVNAGDCYEQKLTVSRHVSISLSDSIVDKVLADASSLLKNKASKSDYACCVQLVREGSIGVFGKVSDGLGDIDSASELRKVWHTSKHTVKVVNSISLPVHIGIFGEADQKDGQAYPGLTMVVTKSAHPTVWAHEFGHLKHIWMHRDDSDKNIMNSNASEIGEINENDCKLIQKGGRLIKKK